MKTLQPTLALLLALTGCSYNTFNDLQERAPAVRIEQEGGVRSASFADGLAGVDRAQDERGGLLAIAGNADPSFSSVSFKEGGSPDMSAFSEKKIEDRFGQPQRLTGVAAAPGSNPSVYVGSPGVVYVVDLITLQAASLLPPNEAPAVDFGLAVVAADFADNEGQRDDVVAGARDAIVLMHTPDKSQVIISGTSPDCASGVKGNFTVVARGDLDGTPGDEVVAAAPDENSVVVVRQVPTCLADTGVPCTSFFCPKVPEGAGRFGAALLIADVNGDDKRELLVGSPDNKTVYVYNLEGTALALLKELSREEADFGKALAFGKVDGVNNLLVVSAPGSTVDGVTSAGRLYLYDNRLELVPNGEGAREGVTLVSPVEDTLLGQRLTIMPFRTTSHPEPYDVLVAGGRDAAFVFFANLTNTHSDIRER